MSLDEVSEAAFKAAVTAAVLRDAVVQARDEGATITELAAAAGVGRQTIYRWLAAGGANREYPEPRKTVQGALRIMSGYLDPHEADQIHRRIDGTTEQLRMAMRMARSWLPPDAIREMPEDERMALGLASEALDRL